MEEDVRLALGDTLLLGVSAELGEMLDENDEERVAEPVREPVAV